jgi:hypothetical protein
MHQSVHVIQSIVSNMVWLLMLLTFIVSGVTMKQEIKSLFLRQQ